MVAGAVSGVWGRAYDGRMKRPALLALLVLATVAAVVAVWWSMRQPAPEVAVSEVQPHEYQADTRPTVEVYGDSVTQGWSRNFAAGDFADRAWLHYAGGPDGVRFVAGSALPGRKAYDSPKGVVPQQTAEVVVWAFGTNDIATDSTWEQFRDGADEFYQATELDDPAKFVVVAVGPTSRRPGATVAEWNARTERLAEERGWTFVDPFGDMRAESGRWADESLTYDGLHPTAEAAERMSEALVPVIRSVAG